MQCKCGTVITNISQGIFLCYQCGLSREIKNNEWKEYDWLLRMNSVFPGLRECVVGFFMKQE